MPPLNGSDTTYTMQTPSLLMRSKSKLSMSLDWAQSLLLSLVTPGKIVSLYIHYTRHDIHSFLCNYLFFCVFCHCVVYRHTHVHCKKENFKQNRNKKNTVKICL